MNKTLAAACAGGVLAVSLAACSTSSTTATSSQSSSQRAQAAPSSSASSSASPTSLLTTTCRLVEIPPSQDGPALVPEITVTNNSNNAVQFQTDQGGLIEFDIGYYNGKLAYSEDNNEYVTMSGNANNDVIDGHSSVTYWPGTPQPGGTWMDDVTGKGYEACAASIIDTSIVSAG